MANPTSKVNLVINGTTTQLDVHDANAIPLAGTNAITGTGFFKSTSDSQLQIGSGTSTITGGCLVTYGSEYSNTDVAGSFRLRASKTRNYDLLGKADGTLTWGTKNVAMQENTVPRSGGAVMTDTTIGRTDNNSYLNLCGGSNWNNGATVTVSGKSSATNTGMILLHPNNGTQEKTMWLRPDGTWTWNGTAVQLVSDQRLKQQIAEIDDKLLDAWEDVEPSQFKYNDAVDQKGKDKARLHTGYVVQQIDSACKEHGVDVSQYGLYCHEEYPQETEEVEVEQADGTKTKETKVIREASEHYSLRYTEVYAVECMYLRRCIARLTARIEELEKGNNTK